MAETAGLAIGSIALLSLFQSCLDTYETVTNLKHKRSDLRFYITKLSFEQRKLSLIKHQLGRVNRHEQQVLIQDTLRTTQDVLQNILDIVQRQTGSRTNNGEVAKSGNKITRAISWAAGDSARISVQIGRLKDLNEQLTALLSPSQLFGLEFGVIAQAVNTSDISELRDVQRAAAESHASISVAADIKLSRIQDIAASSQNHEPKRLQIHDSKSMTWFTAANGTSLKPEKEISFIEANLKDCVLASYIPEGVKEQTNKVVLVEWREGFRSSSTVEARKHRLDHLCGALRRMALTDSNEHLSNDGAISYGILHCQGWIASDQDFSRIGLVFSLPDDAFSNPLSLHDQIIRDRQTRADPPALGIRFSRAIGLSRRLASLIVVGWAHKAIRGQNVLLLPPVQTGSSSPTGNLCMDTEIDNIYLTGFSYARQSMLEDGSADTDLSVLPTDCAAFALYRPPQTLLLARGLGSAGREAGAALDIFGLGIVLLEIGLWRTIQSIYDDVARKQSEKLHVDAFLNSKYMRRAVDSLAARMGIIYRDTVRSCLSLEGWEAQTSTLGQGGSLTKSQREADFLQTLLANLSQCKA